MATSLPTPEWCRREAVALLKKADGSNPDWAVARGLKAQAWLTLAAQLEDGMMKIPFTPPVPYNSGSINPYNT